MNTENNTLETAIRFDVVLPETAKKLEWKESDTFLYWVGVKQMRLCYKKDSNFWSIEEHSLILTEAYNINIFPAPQMREIARELPEVVEYKNKLYCLELAWVGITVLGYTHKTETDDSYLLDYFVKIENLHFSEGFAKLYLKTTRSGLA